MKILSIETSCDETAISLVEVRENTGETHVRVLGNKLLSQVKLHEQYGGVYPNLAKREHAKNLAPLLLEVLKEAGAYEQTLSPLSPVDILELQNILSREPELFHELIKVFSAVTPPQLDAIAVTYGPGLEPALWVGINCARALSHMWSVPIIPTNHMEGHVFSSVLEKKGDNEFLIPPLAFPAVALLISGGHTELIKIEEGGVYSLIGRTRDDAVGEAFDKVARMLGLPYPGGPQISKYAEVARARNDASSIKLPVPMRDSDDFDFSFSGLKTAVRYYLEKLPEVTEAVRHDVALTFENVVGEVLLHKTIRAIEEYGARTFIMGGGVSANRYLRTLFKEKLSEKFPELVIYIPEAALTTDNAVMIAIAAYAHSTRDNFTAVDPATIKAEGSLSLSK